MLHHSQLHVIERLTNRQTERQTDRQTFIYACTRIHIHSHMCTHKQACIIKIHKHLHTCIHTSHAYMGAHTHTHTHAYIHTTSIHTHTYVHTWIHAHTHAYTCAHIRHGAFTHPSACWCLLAGLQSFHFSSHFISLLRHRFGVLSCPNWLLVNKSADCIW